MPDHTSAWLVEEGIGEHRAIRLENEHIVAARIEWPGALCAGWVIDAKLIARSAGHARGTALATNGEEILVDKLPRGATEGAPLRLEVMRGALHGIGRRKRAQARPTSAPLVQPGLAERLDARIVRRFPVPGGWDELIDEALSGEIGFAGGTLLFAPTPAMTTIDIDGDLAPRALALAAAPALARTLARFDLGGSVAVDFPTLADKADRRAVDEALGAALAGWPHERTAMNGFGLVQIVARLERPSLLHLAAWQRAGLVWRRLLRRAEALDGPGATELALHPSLHDAIDPACLRELERRTGRRIALRKDANLMPEAPHVQRIADD